MVIAVADNFRKAYDEASSGLREAIETLVDAKQKRLAIISEHVERDIDDILSTFASTASLQLYDSVDQSRLFGARAATVILTLQALAKETGLRKVVMTDAYVVALNDLRMAVRKHLRMTNVHLSLEESSR